MPVAVHLEERPPITHQDGEGWHVDDYGRLHVRAKDGTPIASYAQGFWRNVVRVSSSSPTVEVHVDGKAIHASLTDLKRRNGGSSLGLA